MKKCVITAQLYFSWQYFFITESFLTTWSGWRAVHTFNEYSMGACWTKSWRREIENMCACSKTINNLISFSSGEPCISHLRRYLNVWIWNRTINDRWREIHWVKGCVHHWRKTFSFFSYTVYSFRVTWNQLKTKENGN